RNINLTVEEWRVVSFINPRNTIRQIARANNLSDFQIRRIVFGLLQAGLVEFVRQPRAARTRRKAEPGTKTDQKPVDQQSPTVKRSVVHRLIDRIRNL
ncbi:MAG: MarR family transcriptional regulator, partial [Chloroflexota bacterium]